MLGLANCKPRSDRCAAPSDVGTPGVVTALLSIRKSVVVHSAVRWHGVCVCVGEGCKALTHFFHALDSFLVLLILRVHAVPVRAVDW